MQNVRCFRLPRYAESSHTCGSGCCGNGLLRDLSREAASGILLGMQSQGLGFQRRFKGGNIGNNLLQGRSKPEWGPYGALPYGNIWDGCLGSITGVIKGMLAVQIMGQIINSPTTLTLPTHLSTATLYISGNLYCLGVYCPVVIIACT